MGKMFKISCNFCPGWSLEWYFQYQPVKYKLTGNLTNIFKMTNNVETFLLFSENSFWFFGRKKRSIYIYKASKCFVRNRIFSISARSSLTAVQYSVLMIEEGRKRRNSRFSKCFGFGILETTSKHHIQYHSETRWWR